ncbi:hypothetical protein OsJ_08747 [Oryza sativa Japonica Group]|uniref:Uncharacterized protein n=1 Tax=Oryza sativa subsp. japonica TaxID=39947 RepID=A3ACC8_ORYSJ|nr:hypothetical protein OsJ_08747 [Oryza sativa Japonica Group]
MKRNQGWAVAPLLCSSLACSEPSYRLPHCHRPTPPWLPATFVVVAANLLASSRKPIFGQIWRSNLRVGWIWWMGWQSGAIVGRGIAPKDEESGGDGGRQCRPSSRSRRDGVHVRARPQDIPKLNSISEENVVNKIVEIQIIQQETKDKLYLKHNSSGICNTKSAYKEVVKRENQNTNQMWTVGI